MSGRALIAIGCDAYEHLKALTGAEADASSIYSLLMKPEVGDYDHARSTLLLSPTLQQIRDTLTATLFRSEGLDALSFVFAGHGAVSGGSFYMAARDARIHALSATAFPLADLLRMIAEAAPRQTYMFIDACQAGGLISDLNVILKSEVMGDFGTPGVTLVATAASNQDAIETNGHGIGTAALLDCIDGSIFLQDTNPALDLVEIGRAVSDRVAAAGSQTPVVWGLNLYGPSSFCRNPHASKGNDPLRSVLVGWPDSETAATISSGLRRLWQPYVTLSTEWNAREFLNRVAPLFATVSRDSSALIDFARRITEACAAQGRESRDTFRETEIRATCAVALLPYSDRNEVADYLSMACADISALAEEALGRVIEGVTGYPFALVTGGMSDLYHLPVRLSKLLGWAGYAAHTNLRFGRDQAGVAQTIASLVASIDETYSLSVVSMSDCQAPYVLTFLTAAAELRLHEDGERILGHLFASAVSCGGRIARADLDPARTLSYLLARASSESPSAETVAQPTELLIVLLRASRLFGLSEELDTALADLDHLALNAYLPDDYREFGAEMISGGRNAVFQIGHDVWSVEDIEAAWPEFPAPRNEGVLMTSILSSLLFPDRTPWFLLPVPSLVDARIAGAMESLGPQGAHPDS